MAPPNHPSSLKKRAFKSTSLSLLKLKRALSILINEIILEYDNLKKIVSLSFL